MDYQNNGLSSYRARGRKDKGYGSNIAC